MRSLPFSLLITLGCSLAATAEWIDLFNGKDLEGWIKRGGAATYAVEEGCVVGTSKLNTSNTFLCTPVEYGDFILEYEFKIDPRLNSGVQIRSNVYPTAKEFTIDGKVIKIDADRVHGYQVEMDPDPVQNRWWSAGIYDEGRRGWLYPGILGGDGKQFGDTGREIFKQGDWNKVRVEAKGDRITTTLNGAPRAAIVDTMTASGFIALQVHGIGDDSEKDGAQVRWRNLRIQTGITTEPAQSSSLSDEEKAAGWKMLWDGKSSAGWRSAKGPEFPKQGWKMEDDELIVLESGGAEAIAGGDIITTEKYSDFELSLDFKITPGANSGIKIFVDAEINKGPGSSIGPEFQVLDDALHPDAKLGRNGNRTVGSLYDMIPAPADKRVKPVGEWNHARILSDGMHVTFWLNGVKTVEFHRGSKEWRENVAISKYNVWPAFGELKEGHILLQDHGNKVHYRNVKIRDFAKR